LAEKLIDEDVVGYHCWRHVLVLGHS